MCSSVLPPTPACFLLRCREKSPLHSSGKAVSARQLGSLLRGSARAGMVQSEKEWAEAEVQKLQEELSNLEQTEELEFLQPLSKALGGTKLLRHRDPDVK